MASNNGEIKIPVEIDVKTDDASKQIAAMFRKAIAEGKGLDQVFDRTETAAKAANKQIVESVNGLSEYEKALKVLDTALTSVFNRARNFKLDPSMIMGKGSYKPLLSDINSINEAFTSFIENNNVLYSGVSTETSHKVQDVVSSLGKAVSDLRRLYSMQPGNTGFADKFSKSFDEAYDRAIKLRPEVETLFSIFSSAPSGTFSSFMELVDKFGARYPNGIESMFGGSESIASGLKIASDTASKIKDDISYVADYLPTAVESVSKNFTEISISSVRARQEFEAIVKEAADFNEFGTSFGVLDKVFGKSLFNNVPTSYIRQIEKDLSSPFGVDAYYQRIADSEYMFANLETEIAKAFDAAKVYIGDAVLADESLNSELMKTNSALMSIGSNSAEIERIRNILDQFYQAQSKFEYMRSSIAGVASELLKLGQSSSGKLIPVDVSGFDRFREVFAQFYASQQKFEYFRDAFSQFVNDAVNGTSRVNAEFAGFGESLRDHVRRMIELGQVIDVEFTEATSYADNFDNGIKSITGHVETLEEYLRRVGKEMEDVLSSSKNAIRDDITDAIKKSNQDPNENLDLFGNAWRDAKRDAKGGLGSFITDTAGFSNLQSSLKGISSVFSELSATAPTEALASTAGGISGVAGAAASAVPYIAAVVLAIKGLVKVLTFLVKVSMQVASVFGKTLLAGLQAGAKELDIVFATLRKIAPVLWDIAKVSIKPLTGDLFEARKQASGLSDTLGQIKSILLMYVSVRGLLRIGKQMLELSSDVIEVQNVVDTVFKDMSGVIDEFAEKTSASFGLSELSAKKYASTFGAVAQATKMSTDNITKLAVNMTKLTADVASFYNLDHDEVFQKIQSGLTGQVQPLRAVGVSVTKANLEAFRLAQGIEKSYSAMNEAERVALRYNFILDSLRVAQGDFTKTSGSWANQVRILTLQIQQLGAVLGGFLQKVLYPVVIAMNNFLALALTAGRSLAKTFGFDAAGLQEQQGLKGQDVGIAMSDGMDEYADSTENAAEATEKLNSAQKKSLANFHQLNILSKDSGSTSGTGAGEAGVGGFGDLSFDLFNYADIDEPESKINEFYEKIKNAIESKDWRGLGELLGSKFTEVFSGIHLSDYSDKAKEVGEALAEIINGFFETGKLSEAARVFGEGANLLIDAWNAFWDKLNTFNTGVNVGEAINELIDQFSPEETARAVTQKFNKFWQFMNGLLQTFNKKSRDLGVKLGDFVYNIFKHLDTESFRSAAKEAGVAFGNVVRHFFMTLQDEVSDPKHEGELVSKATVVGQKIGDIFAGIVSGLANFIRKIPYTDIAQSFVDIVKGALDSVLESKEDIRSGVVSFFNGVKDVINTVVSDHEMWAELGDLAGVVIGSFLEGFANLINGVEGEELGASIIDFISNAFSGIEAEDIGAAIGGLIQLIGEVLLGATERLNETDGWAEIGQSIADFINGVFSSITPETLAQGIINLVNGLTESIKQATDGTHWDEITEKMETFINLVMEGIDWDALGDSVKGFLDHVWDLAVDLLENSEWTKWFSDLLDFVLPILGEAIKSGEDIVGAFLWELFKAAIKLVIGYDKEFEASLGDLAAWIFGILKWSLEFAFGPLGEYLADLLKIAIEWLFGVDFSEETDGVGDNLADSMEKSINKGWQKPEFLQKLENGIKDLASKIKNWWDKLVGNQDYSIDADPIPGTISYQSRSGRSVSSRSVTLSTADFPHLAHGAVIPPNNKFMAILGDQKHGVNIETPLETMVTAFNRSLEKRDTGKGFSGKIVIPVYVDGEMKAEKVIESQQLYTSRTWGILT